MVTETWLTDAIPDEALHIPDSTIVRKDRPIQRGGGVAVYIRESLPFKIRSDFYNSDYECLCMDYSPTKMASTKNFKTCTCVCILATVDEY